MEDHEYSSDLEEKMQDYDHIDYSKFLKPKPKATIHIGKEYQAVLPEINKKKNEIQMKELEKFNNEIENQVKTKNKMRILKAKHVNNHEDQIDSSNKRRKIEEK